MNALTGTPPEYVAKVVRNFGVHRLDDDPDLSGRCHTRGVVGSGYLTSIELAGVVLDRPRRLCGHCWPVKDRT